MTEWRSEWPVCRVFLEILSHLKVISIFQNVEISPFKTDVLIFWKMMNGFVFLSTWQIKLFKFSTRPIACTPFPTPFLREVSYIPKYNMLLFQQLPFQVSYKIEQGKLILKNTSLHLYQDICNSLVNIKTAQLHLKHILLFD